MGQWRGERERGGVGAPSRSGRTAPILPIFNDQEAKSDLGLTILTTGKIVQMAIDFGLGFRVLGFQCDGAARACCT